MSNEAVNEMDPNPRLKFIITQTGRPIEECLTLEGVPQSPRPTDEQSSRPRSSKATSRGAKRTITTNTPS